MDKLKNDPRVSVRREQPVTAEGCCVVYWMQRAQRGFDNPALEIAINLANELKKPVAVFFGLHPGYPNANLRHYAFLLEGLPELATQVEARGAAFIFRPFPDHDLIRFCEEVRPCLVIGDEPPLRQAEGWRQSAARKLRIPFWTVDADVIVPAKFFPREEFAARTLRPKLHLLLPAFLEPLNNTNACVRWRPAQRPAGEAIDAEALLARLPLDRRAGPVRAYQGGSSAGKRLLQQFIHERLSSYDTDRNLPDKSATSAMSAYLHFGHLGPHTIALAIQNSGAPKQAIDAYLEELIVRRELAVNFVVRNPLYDRLEGCPDWGRKTLREHMGDVRDHLYSDRDFEAAETHDPLWNAAQLEMVVTGRMHGYLRMYWAKKILEWTRSPQEAYEIAVRLNDRYELDGRDPNGYAGIAWAVGGKHDRPWGPARPVFGMIRYMNYNGCARKFDVKAYLRRVESLAGR